MDNRLPNKLPAFLWHFVRRYPVANSFILLTSFAWTLDQVAWPYIFKLLIDGITSYKGDKANLFSALSHTLWLMFCLWLTIEIMFRTRGILMSFYFPKMDAGVHRDLFSYVQKHSHRYYTDRLVGSIADKIGGQMAGSATMLNQLIMTIFIPGFASVCIAVIIMGTLHYFFALLLGGWCILYLAIGIIGGKGISKRTAAQAEALSTMHGACVDSLGNHATAKLYSRHNHEAEYVDRLRKVWMQKQKSALLYKEKIHVIMGLSGGVAYFGLIFLAIYNWQQNNITTGDVVYVLSTSWNIFFVVWDIANNHIPNFFKQTGICTQAMRTVLVPHDVIDAPNAKPLVVKSGEIVFDNVHFHYIAGHDIFRDKNLTIRAGEKVGLVGFSGSGKSTFVNLILRFYDVESGRILIDGQNITEVTQDSVREAIAMIPQETTLFHRTLMENIRYGRPDASDDEVIEASKNANCHEFIMQTEEGYDSLVGERGVKLSGGQRQRIAIARAILKNASIIILDEATSALDSVTERMIQHSLSELMKGRTTIVIAHRLSTLSAMDRIIVFKEGEIIEDGSHQELLASDGHYAMLWNMQAGGFLPDVNELVK